VAPDHGENWQAIASEPLCSFYNLLMFSARSQLGRAGKAAPSGAHCLALARPPKLWQPFFLCIFPFGFCFYLMSGLDLLRRLLPQTSIL
jgi:hypothetical protein